MRHIEQDQCAPSERLLLFRELEATCEDLDLDVGVLELVVGVPSGTFASPGLPDLSPAAERQIRRLVEVASTARLLLGDGKVGCWLHTPVPGLGHRSPMSIMLRPGGLAHLRDLLREAVEELVAGS